MSIKPDKKAQLSRILKRAIRTDSGCLLFVGASKGNGYGHLSSEGRNIPAHRFVYEMVNSASLDSLVDVCHKCDNRRCIEPTHLFTGSRMDNMRDCVAKGRISSGVRHALKICGERSSAHKLSLKEVIEIRSLISLGHSNKSIAEKFNVTADNISKIKRGKTWRYGNV